MMDDRRPERGRRLVVVAGAAIGDAVELPAAVSLVGREADADIRLPFDAVSRRHVLLDATGDEVLAVDQQSRNGTWVNGRRIESPTVLHDGDRLVIGPVALRFDDVVEQTGSPATAGARQSEARAGDEYTARRDQFIAAGNQTWNQTVNVSAEEDATDEIFEGRGPGRWMAIIGMVVALSGFAWAVYTFFRLATYQGPDIPEFPPEFVYAFAMFAGGGILAGVGSGISRAQRRREGR